MYEVDNEKKLRADTRAHSTTQAHALHKQNRKRRSQESQESQEPSKRGVFSFQLAFLVEIIFTHDRLTLPGIT